MRSGSSLILAICSRNVLLLFLSLFISFYSSSFIQKSLFAVIRVHLRKMYSLLAEQHVFMKKCINYFKFECNHKSLFAIAEKIFSICKAAIIILSIVMTSELRHKRNLRLKIFYIVFFPHLWLILPLMESTKTLQTKYGLCAQNYHLNNFSCAPSYELSSLIFFFIPNEKKKKWYEFHGVCVIICFFNLYNVRSFGAVWFLLI